MISRLQNKLLFDPPDVQQDPSCALKRSDFEFQRKIGDGAFGQVWRVKNKKTQKFFALKQVPKPKVLKMLPQFRRELFILYELSHPHIVKLETHFEDDKFFYLLMELLEGGTLFHKLYREKNLLEGTAAQYFRELLLAIEYLHSRNPPIVHRDIKPENILIDKDGRIKLIDFGWANYCESGPRLTICGTVEYLSPEMIENKGHGKEVDIWCLGVLLFEMLVGHTPFQSLEKERIPGLILEGRVKFPLSMPPLAKDLISSLLEKNIGKRLNVFQIKEHRWLADVKPIRETTLQNYKNVEIPYKIKDFSKKEQPTATSINSDSEEEFTFLIKNPPKYTKTVQKLTPQKNQKKNEFEIDELSQNKYKLDGLEEKIAEKKKEMIRVTVTSKELLSKVFDANLELERLQGEDVNELAEKNRNLQKNILELSKNCKFHKRRLEELRKTVNKESLSIANNEMNLKKLQSTLKMSQEMSKVVNSEKKSSENEMRISILMLRVQLQEKTSILSSFSPCELLIAKEISGVIRANAFGFSGLTRDIKKKIEAADEKFNEIEQQVHELKISYEMRKSLIFQVFTKAKDEFIHKQRQLKEEKYYVSRKKTETAKEDIRKNLASLRKTLAPIDDTVVLKAKGKIQVLSI